MPDHVDDANCCICGKPRDRVGEPSCRACAQVNSNTSGYRDNADKVRLELISPHALHALGLVLTAGTKKYPARNWEKGLSWSETVGSLLRHLTEFMAGNDYDDGPGGTGLPHIYLAQCNAHMLSHFFATSTGTDDRPRLLRTELWQGVIKKPLGEPEQKSETGSMMPIIPTKCTACHKVIVTYHPSLPDLCLACSLNSSSR